jgi:hypothetical protein
MKELSEIRLIWAAGAIQAGIVLVNGILPGRLRVREGVQSVPEFIRQIFYVHWVYIVLTVGFFSVLCFGFARDLAGASALGRFLSGFMGGFWTLRIALQFFYYDRRVRRANRWLDAVYLGSLIALSFIFARAVFASVA